MWSTIVSFLLRPSRTFIGSYENGSTLLHCYNTKRFGARQQSKPMKGKQSDERDAATRAYTPPYAESFSIITELSILHGSGGTGGIVPDPDDGGDD